MQDYIYCNEIKNHVDKELLKVEINNLGQKHQQLEENMNKTFSDIIKSYTKDSINVYCNDCGRGFYFEIEFLDESGKRVFGSDISGNYMENRRNRGQYTLYFNVGTIGLFCNDDIYQVKKYLLLADLIKHAGDIEKRLENSDFSELGKIKSTLMDLHFKLNGIEREEKEIRKRNIQEGIVRGTIFKRKDSCNKCAIIKITPKYYYYQEYVYSKYYDSTSSIERKIQKEDMLEDILNGYITLGD